MEGNNLIKKALVVAVILLFISVSVIPSTGTVVKKSSHISFDGNTLYVGGSGPGNYTRIQDAIDDASDGDTVFVFNESSPYYEKKIKVDKSISLVGENRNTTVIDGGDSFATISVLTNHVNIKGFTILGSIKIEANYTSISGNIINITRWECIRIRPPLNTTYYHDNIITNNLLFSSASGIVIIDSHNNIISNNKIDSGGPLYGGISLRSSNDSIISGNIIRNSGIFFHRCNNNVIIENRISTCEYGIYLDAITNSCSFNMITRNVIYSNDIGIFLNKVRTNIIFENNFLNNSRDVAVFVEVFGSQNHLIKNYWNRPRILPKLILGYFWTGSIWIPWFNIDWRPALRPYDIPEV